MDKKITLTIRGWSGKSTGAIDIKIGSFTLIERTLGSRTTRKLLVYRKPDQYSSRLGMMANLNKNSRSLSWGFTEMSLTIEDFSAAGAILSSKTYDFAGIAVADSRMNGDDEEVTFVFNKKSEFIISNVVRVP
jgi:hypothetical protein